MDLFTASNEQHKNAAAPLAARMRPQKLEEFVGQEEILGEGKMLRRAIEADRVTSLIFYGPPGTGKTTLAEIIAQSTKAFFERINAVTSGVGEIRQVITKAQERYSFYQQKTILFIDEIHRFNKAQQDALLPAVEDGTLIMIGATTENPLYEVNTPLISRSMIFRLQALTAAHLTTIIKRALHDGARGVGKYQAVLDDGALQYLLNMAGGDARIALNALELAVLTTKPEEKSQKRLLSREIMRECIQERPIIYNKAGEAHYDTISAFIKALRGSDPDAAIYYLARMLTAGEDPKFIARRLIIQAAEDVGNADPRALQIATAAAQAVEMIGLPEGRIPLAQATIYVATAPKSNAAYEAINRALADVQKKENYPVPTHLQDASHSASRRLGRGEGYLYPHNYPNGYVPQAYLPENLKEMQYYQPTNHGYEATINEYLLRVQEKESGQENNRYEKKK